MYSIVAWCHHHTRLLHHHSGLLLLHHHSRLLHHHSRLLLHHHWLLIHHDGLTRCHHHCRLSYHHRLGCHDHHWGLGWIHWRLCCWSVCWIRDLHQLLGQLSSAANVKDYDNDDNDESYDWTDNLSNKLLLGYAGVTIVWIIVVRT